MDNKNGGAEANFSSGPQDVDSPDRELLEGEDKSPVLPLALALLMWTFPYWYLYFCGLTVFAIAAVFKFCGLQADQFIPMPTLSTIFLYLPVLLFIVLFVKSALFRSHIFYLPILWAIMYWTMGLTSGAISSGLSKAYSAGTEISAHH